MKGDLTKFEGDYKIEQDKETGLARVTTDKPDLYTDSVSNFASGQSNIKKKFATDEFDSRRWQGAKDKDLKKWNGNRNYEYSPEFVKQNSHLASKTAQESGRDYSGSDVYKTYAANQNSAQRIDKEENYSIKKRSETYKAPKIVDRYDLVPRSGRTVEDVKGLLNQ